MYIIVLLWELKKLVYKYIYVCVCVCVCIWYNAQQYNIAIPQ